MTVARRFGEIAAVKPALPAEIVYTVPYEEDDDGHPVGGVEKFNFYPMVPGGVTLDFVGSAWDNVRMAGEIIAFLDAAVVKADRERFDELIHDPERNVSIDTLGDLAEWLMTHYYPDRPTPPPSTSRSGRRRTGRTSGAKR